MKGIGASPGIAIGKAFVMKKNLAEFTGILLTNSTEIEAAVAQFDKAIISAMDEVSLIKINSSNLSDNDSAILETQIELLGDPEIREIVIEKIKAEHKNSGDAVLETIASFVQVFESMEDAYMRARSADIQDIGNRILKNLDISKPTDQLTFKPDTIIIAEDLSPSDTITLDITKVIGVATQVGSQTSHAAIIAKAKGIPAVVGCGKDIIDIKNDDIIILDGITGEIFINPNQNVIDEYTIKRNTYQQHSDNLKALRDVPAITTDGLQVTLTANISGAEDLADVFDNGGEGVGLLRTELLFMNRDNFPSEDEQFEFYKNTALKAKGKPVIVRTIDVGGDKHLPYFNLPAELNPFLGYRAIRICLDRKDLFITQLKAILQASVFGDLKIMFPMISDIKEIKSAKSILDEAREELRKSGIAFKADVKVGIMVEIPSAAITADLLAKEVDFFSIGTNDLCQYTLAVDRMNEKISHLYDPFNPAILRLISFVIEQGAKQNIHVGMCGEMASNPLATSLLMGMGLKEFSMSAASIPAIKSIIINSSELKAKQVWENVKKMDNSDEILGYLKGIN